MINHYKARQILPSTPKNIKYMLLVVVLDLFFILFYSFFFEIQFYLDFNCYSLNQNASFFLNFQILNNFHKTHAFIRKISNIIKSFKRENLMDPLNLCIYQIIIKNIFWPKIKLSKIRVRYYNIN